MRCRYLASSSPSSLEALRKEHQWRHLLNIRLLNLHLYANLFCLMFQKLREAFAENELPSRDIKRKISEQLGLEYEKVKVSEVLDSSRHPKAPDYPSQNYYRNLYCGGGLSYIALFTSRLS